MTTVKLEENKNGNFGLRRFGISVAGKNGDQQFRLVIESADRGIYVELIGVTTFDIFDHLDLMGNHFSRDCYRSTDFIRVSTAANVLVLEASNVFVETVKGLQNSERIENRSTVNIAFVGPSGVCCVFNSKFRGKVAA